MRVIARIPREEVEHANYYGDLLLKASYPDGQSAGETEVSVFMRNTRQEDEYKCHFDKVLLLSEEESKKIVTCSIVNIGNAHFHPLVHCSLLDGMEQEVLSTELEGSQKAMLPLDSRSFSGVIDFDSVPEGTYSMVLGIKVAEDKLLQNKVPVYVEAEEGVNQARILNKDMLESNAAAQEN